MKNHFYSTPRNKIYKRGRKKIFTINSQHCLIIESQILSLSELDSLVDVLAMYVYIQ